MSTVLWHGFVFAEGLWTTDRRAAALSCGAWAPPFPLLGLVDDGEPAVIGGGVQAIHRVWGPGMRYALLWAQGDAYGRLADELLAKRRLGVGADLAVDAQECSDLEALVFEIRVTSYRLAGVTAYLAGQAPAFPECYIVPLEDELPTPTVPEERILPS
jgi:hypothetical protein